jgi:hypothetical protein
MGATRRQRLSTHAFRRTARAAQTHYENLQYTATLDGPAGEYARQACAHLHVGLDSAIKVEPARYERGRWVVIAA